MWILVGFLFGVFVGVILSGIALAAARDYRNHAEGVQS